VSRFADPLGPLTLADIACFTTVHPYPLRRAVMAAPLCRVYSIYPEVYRFSFPGQFWLRNFSENDTDISGSHVSVKGSKVWCARAGALLQQLMQPPEGSDTAFVPVKLLYMAFTAKTLFLKGAPGPLQKRSAAAAACRLVLHRFSFSMKLSVKLKIYPCTPKAMSLYAPGSIARPPLML
jgi:hypothetical protein